MDDYQVRNPTAVSDVARVLYDLSRLPTLPPVTHYRSPGPSYTKWDMTRVIARHLSLPTGHITPVSTKPEIGPGQTERPWNTALSVDSLVALGVDTAEEKSFDDWWGAYLANTKA